MGDQVAEALGRLHRTVAGMSDADLSRLAGICHFLRPNLTGDHVVLADVLDEVKRLAVAVWLDRTGGAGELDEVLAMINAELNGGGGGGH